MKRHFLWFLFLLIFLCPGEPAALTIDFEGWADGTLLREQYAGWGIHFSGATVLTAALSLDEAECPPNSGENVLFNDGGPLGISFDSPLAGFGAYFTYSHPLVLLFYDGGGTLLGNVGSGFSNNLALSGAPGSSPNEYLAFSGVSITRVVITGGPVSSPMLRIAPAEICLVMDDLTLATVPEPASIFLLGILLTAVLSCASGFRKLTAPRLAAWVALAIGWMLFCPEAFAAPHVPRPSFSPPALYAGDSVPVTFRVQLAEPGSIVGSVNLVLADGTGRLLSVIGSMNDDGMSGDERAGDGMYTLRKEVLGNEAGQIWVRVSVPYRGLIKRVLSEAVAIPVYSVNQPPVAHDREVTADRDKAVEVRLGATDEYGDPLKYSIVSPPAHGTLSGSPPQVRYTPANHYSGLDRFTFKANDGKLDSNTATVYITVVIPRGSVRGGVTNSLDGKVVPGATVSLTDFGNETKTCVTDGSGKYLIEGVLEGSFAGSITKEGFKVYPLSGAVMGEQVLVKNVALDPMVPIISNAEVNNLTANSATIIWMTDQPSDSRVDYGPSVAYGNWEKDAALTTSHTVKLTNLAPGIPYHFRITSANGYGFSSSSPDQTFITRQPLLSLAITSPVEGPIIGRTDVLVKGTVVNGGGNETGVTVNGRVAAVAGNEFFLNHVPVSAGANRLEAKATDAAGNTAVASLNINAVPPAEKLILRANVESGLSPLEVYLTVDSSLNLKNASFIYDGPGEVTVLSRGEKEYRVRMEEEGVYYFTVSAAAGSAPYADTIAVLVLPKAEVEALLAGKWEGMKGALQRGDVEGALQYFAWGAKDRYRRVFEELGQAKINAIFSNITGIKLYSLSEEMADCGVLRQESGGIYSYPATFMKDENGIWRIMGF